MNVLLVVVDSLRAKSLLPDAVDRPATPFFDWLSAHTIHFTRAHATECWTLPTHMSMFTGLLPSEHGAHFQTMAYRGSHPTVAEIFAEHGFHTAVITRNSLFDGTVPGATRGFAENAKVLAGPTKRTDPLSWLLAASKPRIRRLIRESGFFTTMQRENGAFLSTLARMIVPADEEALAHTLVRMRDLRRRNTPFFLFVNLYDVHAPYPPTLHSPLASFRDPGAWIENLLLPKLATQLGGHAYLREGFSMPPRSRDILLRRYHRAIELMDGKIERFYREADAEGLLEDTVLVVTSDHGEAFGEHDLYFHDASVYETHLHVPLWVRHPEMEAGTVDDLVSTRELFGLFANLARGGTVADTLLDPDARRRHPVALAEHFHYPHVRNVKAQFGRDMAAVILADRTLLIGAAAPSGHDPAYSAHRYRSHEGGASDRVSQGELSSLPPYAREHIDRWQN